MNNIYIDVGITINFNVNSILFVHFLLVFLVILLFDSFCEFLSRRRSVIFGYFLGKVTR